MLLFSTILSITKELTKDKFIELVIKWNQGSPHLDNIIPDIVWNGEKSAKFKHNNLSLEIEEYSKENIVAVRYEKIDDDGVVWDTDYIMNFATYKMAIRLDRSYLENAISSNPNFSTPHFISLLIEEGYLEKDDELDVSNKPMYIYNEDIEKVVEIVNGKRYRLPVVYVSKTYYDESPLDENKLASRLKGVAHIMVQESNCSNPRLKDLCAGENEYYGAVGIYYPKQSNKHTKFLHRQYPGYEKHYLDRVVNAVISHSNARTVDPLYTWQGVHHALLRDNLESQKKERAEAESARRETLLELLSLKGQQESARLEAIENAKEEAGKILESFEEDMRRLQEQIDQLSHENEKLQAENQGLKVRLDSKQEIPLLFMGTETEFYSGEIKDLVLSTLNDRLANIPANTRRYDIVQDIIQANDFQHLSKERADKIKNLLNAYSGMTTKVSKGLEELGFVITHDGEHYKATYYGDDRYIIVHSATPSDARAGRNNASSTIKKVF